jgi:uncharacterized protein (DUF433 family)
MINRITVNPKIHFGKPCIAGTRIPVQSVLELLNEALSFEEIIEDYYPDLTVADIQACLEYAIVLIASEVNPHFVAHRLKELPGGRESCAGK